MQLSCGKSKHVRPLLSTHKASTKQQYKQQHPEEDKWKCAVCRRKSAYPEEEKDDEDVPLAQLRRRGM